MQYSQGKFSNFFYHGLRVVRSNGRITIYVRKLNQNPVYFLMSGGKVLHTGTRKHVMRKFREYVPMDTVGQYLTA